MIICNDVFLEYDYFVIDFDGDQFVYEFCVLFLGGGFQLDFVFYNICMGVNFILVCLFFYNIVIFWVFNYMVICLMVGDLIIMIDLVMGLIIGMLQF